MLLDGRKDESSTYQARKIEKKEPLSAETNQFQQKKGTMENHVEIVVETIPIRVFAQQKENSAENA